MNRGSAIAAATLCALASPATSADAPPTGPRPVETICAGTTATGACATIDRRTGQTVARRRQVPHALLWTMPSAPAFAVLSADGRFLVEEHRPGGLIETGDGPATPLLTLYDGGRRIRRVTLGDLMPTTDGLPNTASHRIWSRARYFADRTHYVVVLTTGRTVSFDLANRGVAAG